MPLPDCTPFGDCEFHKLSIEQIFKFLIIDDGTGCPTLKTSATLTSGSGVDYELRRSTYKANTAGTGYSIGDYIQRVDIVNVTVPGIVSALWFNETTGLSIGVAPTQADLDPFTEPISIGDGGSVSLGAKADAAAGTDTGTFSLIALIKRLLQKSTALQALFPVALGQTTMANSLAVTIASNQSALSVVKSLTETVSSVRDVAFTNTAIAIKNAPGNLLGWNIINPNVTAVYVKFYNEIAASVIVGTTVPVLTLMVPASGTVYLEPSTVQQNFSVGISATVVTGLADNNTVAPGTNLMINIKYN